jgi:ArsR family transcriptional regulator, arsenate/arsenite/antimonite-responsive transcriptional repressor
MELNLSSNQTVVALSALAQEHRLSVFRLLVEAGPGGLSAGTLAGRLALPASSLSFHLSQLLTANLVSQTRQGRTLIYRANFDVMSGLIAYLSENCCQGSGCGIMPADCLPQSPIKSSERKIA